MKLAFKVMELHVASAQITNANDTKQRLTMLPPSLCGCWNLSDITLFIQSMDITN